MSVNVRWARRGAAGAGMVAMVVGAAACRDAGDGPYAARVREAVPRIEQATGLRFKTPPKVEARSREQVREFLLAKFDEAQPAQELAAEEATYKALGLIPETMNLRRFLLDLLGEQIIGFYDPAAKTLYVVEGGRDDLVGITITHELVHALQDQYLNLDSIQKATGDADRQAAAQAVIEGQATYEQLALMVGGRGNIASALPGGWDRMRELIRENQSQAPIFAAAPTLIQESLIFPYLSGADFVRRYHERRPGKVPFGEMPVSTEQILHTPAYFDAPRDAPTVVVLPPAGAEKVYENTVGEFATRLFLYEHSQDQAAALRAATGWDGDRLRLVRTPAGDAVYWVSVWDSPTEAAEFVDVLSEAVERRYAAGAYTRLPANGRRWTARGRTVDIVPGEIAGRTVVMYVDVPAGQPTSAVDLRRVKLE